MTVTVLYFAHYQDVAGVRGEPWNLPEAACLADLARAVEQRYPSLTGLLDHGRAAVNAAFADSGTILSNGDEIAWMPPMSGG